MVRVAAFLRRAWSFEKAISIGLKSGEYGGRNRSRANLLDHLAPAADLVGGQVVHEHDVAGAKLGCADLLRLGEEARTIRRAVEQHWRRQAAQPQAGRECGGLPMAVRNGRPASFAAQAAATQPRHLCGCCGLIDENQPLGVEIELAIEPASAAAQDIGALLFGGVRRLLLKRDAAPVEVQPDRGRRCPHAALGGKALHDLSKRDVRRVLDETKNEGLRRIELRTRRLALLARFHLAGLATAAIPTPGRRNTDPEATRRLPRRKPRLQWPQSRAHEGPPLGSSSSSPPRKSPGQ